MSNTVVAQMHDILSFMVLRLFAKRKKGMISENDFQMVAGFGAAQALGIVTVSHRRRDLEEMMDEELKKTVELLSDSACSRCRGRGIVTQRGARYVICKCVNPVFYRGDSVVELGEQYSNKYFEGETSLDQMGKTDTVQNIAAAVMMFIMPRPKR